uniref:Uncharacterized protein n=1 Tax=Molossus molossus TaxID=27622 RepID=A0A7J8C8L4_MOLMO|nr:hypothetical protein HJG59_009859 [Molossus molossus]
MSCRQPLLIISSINNRTPTFAWPLDGYFKSFMWFSRVTLTQTCNTNSFSAGWDDTRRVLDQQVGKEVARFIRMGRGSSWEGREFLNCSVWGGGLWLPGEFGCGGRILFAGAGEFRSSLILHRLEYRKGKKWGLHWGTQKVADELIQIRHRECCDGSRLLFRSCQSGGVEWR